MNNVTAGNVTELPHLAESDSDRSGCADDRAASCSQGSSRQAPLNAATRTSCETHAAVTPAVVRLARS